MAALQRYWHKKPGKPDLARYAQSLHLMGLQ